MADNPEFDLKAAISHLRRAATSPEGDKIRAALSNHSLSAEDIRESLPFDFSILLPTLLFDEAYSMSYRTASTELRPMLKEAKAIAEQHFGEFSRHPAVAERFQSAVSQMFPSAADWPELRENRRIFVGAEPRWQDDEGMLVPTMRLAFLGPADKSVVVMAADPTDPLILSSTLLGVARAEFERCASMAEKGLLKFPYAELVPELLDDLDAELQRLRDLAKKLGLTSKMETDVKSQKPSRERDRKAKVEI